MRNASSAGARLISATAASRVATERAALRTPADRMAVPPTAAAPIAPSVLTSCIGSRASGSARLTSGITAIASASFMTPRTPGTASAALAPRLGLGPDATLISPGVVAYRRCPVGGAVHEQAVAQRHSAQPQLLLGHRGGHRSVFSMSSE